MRLSDKQQQKGQPFGAAMEAGCSVATKENREGGRVLRLNWRKEIEATRIKNVGSGGPASPSQPVVGVVSLVCFPPYASFDFPIRVQAGNGTTLFNKKQSLRVVQSTDEETVSDDASLRPRKMRKMVSMPKLLGGIRDIISDKFVVPGQKQIAVVPSSLKESPSPFTSIFSFNLGSNSVLGGALGASGYSSPSEKPSMVDEMRTVSHTMVFRLMLQVGLLLRIPYRWETSLLKSGVAVLIPRQK
ncbi:unnamed protein product [Lactuca saligna]|uniref:Uncharacterized protein n=1 Tax=Lactuca saligna TaxID=75948 RepID=A0AA36A2C4_LACSI|nr:unnamed protein product [Lactuca saligna]